MKEALDILKRAGAVKLTAQYEDGHIANGATCTEYEQVLDFYCTWETGNYIYAE